jgi:dienelactone hydrolase
VTPEGAGPFPVVLQLHGCAGIRAPFQQQWAAVANKAGYAAVIIDSNGARGMDRAAGLEKVCGGKTLLGQERAGDIAAVLEIIKQDQRIDSSKIVLAGWSHGAWTVMDYLTMDLAAKAPPGFVRPLTNVPDVEAAVLFYPYCGVGARSRFAAWTQHPKTLALIAGADEVVDASQCINYFEKRERAGDSLEMVIYPDANHVFDDPFLEPDYIHWYKEEYFADAKTRYEAFLKALP